MTRRFDLRVETLPLAAPFRISRGEKREVREIRVAVAEGALAGEGTSVPYARYGESVESVLATLEALRSDVEGGLQLDELQDRLQPGSARNALDCALWDLRAKKQGRPVTELIDVPAVNEFSTMRTVVLDTPENMAGAAAAFPKGGALKVKLDGERVLERLGAVHAAAPSSPLVADPNEGWDAVLLKKAFPQLRSLGVVLLEQPLSERQDGYLSEIAHPVPVCADESCRTVSDLPRLKGRYDALNIKLDKTGGFTGALALHRAAREEGFKVMLGCLTGSALAVAPLVALAGAADYIDLDGPLLLAKGYGGGMEEIPGSLRVRFNHPWGRARP
ncbi:MAG TPA: dipeptide epimerase [Sphingomonadales bacterium]|nr:dipeptide epimerase [Sphingomonadales bacterium]